MSQFCLVVLGAFSRGVFSQEPRLDVVLREVGRLDVELGQGVSHHRVRHACCELQCEPLLVQRDPCALRRGGLHSCCGPFQFVSLTTIVIIVCFSVV